MPSIISPVVANSKSPAWFVAAGVHWVKSSWSHHAILRRLVVLAVAPAHNIKTKRSSVTTIDLAPLGACVTNVAGFALFNIH